MPREPIERVHSERTELAPWQADLLVARAFTNGRYPLTYEGEQLRQYTASLLEAEGLRQKEQLQQLRDKLPTVEAPHLELYVPLDNTAEGDQLFGFDLDVISITKGCTHGCAHCIVDAQQLRKEDIMPFPAILQIAERKRQYEAVVAAAWQEWYEVTVDERRLLAESENKFGEDRKRLVIALQKAVEQKFTEHPVRQFLSDFGSVIPQAPDFMRTVFMAYDAEPSDYRDASFRHKDGSSADWGDAFTALATPLRPVSITTAGWLTNNRAALCGAEKIVDAVRRNPKLLLRLGISINPYDELYRRNPTSYVQSMRKVIQLFGCLGPRLWCRSEEGIHQEFDRSVIQVLADQYKSEFINSGGILPERRKEGYDLIWHRRVSHYAGRAFQPDSTRDPDTMNVSAGRHIWPDGQIAFKPYSARKASIEFDSRLLQMSGNKGERPQPTGRSIFTTHSAS